MANGQYVDNWASFNDSHPFLVDYSQVREGITRDNFVAEFYPLIQVCTRHSMGEAVSVHMGQWGGGEDAHSTVGGGVMYLCMYVWRLERKGRYCTNSTVEGSLMKCECVAVHFLSVQVKEDAFFVTLAFAMSVAARRTFLSQVPQGSNKRCPICCVCLCVGVGGQVGGRVGVSVGTCIS